MVWHAGLPAGLARTVNRGRARYVTRYARRLRGLSCAPQRDDYTIHNTAVSRTTELGCTPRFTKGFTLYELAVTHPHGGTQRSCMTLTTYAHYSVVLAHNLRMTRTETQSYNDCKRA